MKEHHWVEATCVKAVIMQTVVRYSTLFCCILATTASYFDYTFIFLLYDHVTTKYQIESLSLLRNQAKLLLSM